MGLIRIYGLSGTPHKKKVPVCLFKPKTPMSQKVKFTPFDLETLFPFAEECSADIIRDIEEGNFEADPRGYTPEDCLGHLVMWGEANSLSVLNIMESFNWRDLTSELGLR